MPPAYELALPLGAGRYRCWQQDAAENCTTTMAAAMETGPNRKLFPRKLILPEQNRVAMNKTEIR